MQITYLNPSLGFIIYCWVANTFDYILQVLANDGKLSNMDMKAQALRAGSQHLRAPFLLSGRLGLRSERNALACAFTSPGGPVINSIFFHEWYESLLQS